MAGIQVSGLVSGINWQSIVSELITADSAGINAVKAQQTKVNTQASALGSLGTDLNSLSSAVFTLEDPGTYGGVVAGSTTSGSSWITTAASGTPLGTTTLAVTQLATASQLQGASGISSPLSATSDVSGLTLATLPVAQTVTAGTLTVNGQQVTVTTAESLQDVFNAISTATGGTVTGSYDPTQDKVSLTSTSGPVVLGAANDTSNLFSALKLANNGSTSVTSSSALGAVQLSQPLASADLKAALTGLDSSGNGSLTINGVAISYNANTDTLGTVLGRINNSGAGVTAAYDSAHDRLVITNNVTGDSGVGLSDTSGNLLAALGVAGTSPTLVRGLNALYSVNNGPTQASASNTLTGAQLGVTGLSVTVDSLDTQNLEVQNDATTAQNAITAFITAFNAVQTDVANDTKITTSSTGTTVTSAVLAANHDVGSWASSLQATAFSAGSGVGGAITSLDALGIDFDGTTGQLKVADTGKLTQALTQNPAAVESFFRTAKTGFGSVMNAEITDITSQNTSQTESLQSQSTDLGNQITSMQTQLDAEQAQLETEFQAMETALSSLQNETSALSSMFSGTSSTTSSGNLSTALNNAVTSGTSSSTSSSTGTSGTSSSSTTG
jgi:flagellar hook-associated protein 2